MTLPVLIIGGGILGAATAAALARRGQAVTLIERGRIGQGTTGASFGWANASTKTGDQAYHDLNAAGVAGWEALWRTHGVAVGYTPTGSLQIVGAADTAGHAALKRDAHILASYGYAARPVGASDLPALEPDLSLPPNPTGLLCPRDAVIDGPKAARWFADRAATLGAQVLEQTEALSILMEEDGRVTGIETTAGPIAGRAILICTGRDTGATLANLTGFDGYRLRFPLREVPGLILQTPPLPASLRPRHILWTSTTEELHMMPTAGGGLRMGSDDLDRYAENPTPARMLAGGQALIARADHWLPGLAQAVRAEDCTLSVGVRPYPTDGQTIAGALPGAMGVFVAATHSGITLAPVLAEELARLILGHPGDRLAPFALSRFAGFRD